MPDTLMNTTADEQVIDGLVPEQVILREKDPAFRVLLEKPLCGTPPPEALTQAFYTIPSLFFVRNHGSVPRVNPATYRLRVGGLVDQPLELSLEVLRHLPKYTVTATLQCAGNRRQEQAAVAPLDCGLLWDQAAVSTAAWSGVALRDLLWAAGVRDGARHVAFAGLDDVERQGLRFQYGASIPLDKAMSGDVLLAYEMNGLPLPPVHGAPLRVIVPGFIGARSVKWLGAIHVQATPSDNYFQQFAYRRFGPETTPASANWTTAPAIEDVLVNAASTAMRRTARGLYVRGYALTGDGAGIERVEVSCDNGQTWRRATLEPEERRWAWRVWRMELPGPVVYDHLLVRARDGRGRWQPRDLNSTWNFKGYLNNAWHRLSINTHDSV